MIKLYESDFDLFFSDENLSLGIRLDSNSKIFRFEYQSENQKYTELLSSLEIQDQVIEILLESINLKERFLKQSSLEANQLLLILRSTYNKYIHSNLSKDMFLDSTDRLVCRCMGITQKDLDLAYKNNQADRVKAIKDTNASMGCSSCREDVMSFFDKHFLTKVDDQSIKILNEINKSLEEFNLYSSQELADYLFVAVSVKNAQVKIKATKGKINVPRAEITKTLQNFLGEKLLNGLGVSIFY